MQSRVFHGPVTVCLTIAHSLRQDPTGVVEGTLHRKLLADKRLGAISAGSALVLQQVRHQYIVFCFESRHWSITTSQCGIQGFRRWLQVVPVKIFSLKVTIHTEQEVGFQGLKLERRPAS
jgi:hypothetical protein